MADEWSTSSEERLLVYALARSSRPSERACEDELEEHYATSLPVRFAVAYQWDEQACYEGSKARHEYRQPGCGAEDECEVYAHQ
jgi:hypothetical protein